MNSFKSHFKFNKQERSGIFFLLFFLITVQVGYFFYDAVSIKKSDPLVFNGAIQEKIDSLKMVSIKNDTLKIVPFNPNFISDFKGYTLGMSIDEIDRLHAFRAKDKFINSKLEFQEVTGVSDSLLDMIAPFFKFPDWVRSSSMRPVMYKNSSTEKFKDKTVQWIDLNAATAKDLQSINGIGEKLSARIVKFRDRLGGFLADDQLFEVYGLAPEIAKRALSQFKVIKKPEIVKINVNTATVEELSKLIYIQKEVAQHIVNYRDLNGGINSLNELVTIEGFPTERFDRIALYLSL